MTKFIHDDSPRITFVPFSIIGRNCAATRALGAFRAAIVFVKVAITLAAGFAASNAQADSFSLTSTPFRSGSPGIWSRSGVSPAEGGTQVTITLTSVADLGCSQFDRTHAFQSCTPGSGCDTDPTSKYVKVRINAGLGPAPLGGVLIDSSIANQVSGHGPVPAAGDFFRQWSNDDPLLLEYGRSPCTGDIQGAANTHVFSVTAATWNAWLSPTGYVEVRVDASGVANLQTYCQSIHPAPCSCTVCAPTTSVGIVVSYTAASPGACCLSNGLCISPTIQTYCTSQGGTWGNGANCACSGTLGDL